MTFLHSQPRETILGLYSIHGYFRIAGAWFRHRMFVGRISHLRHGRRWR
jgi:hypothetical protein